MSATNAFETSILQLIFNATAIANIADNASSSPATSLYISLHTADPGETGNQTSSEATYTSYARQAVTRLNTGWTVSGDTASNAAIINFPTATGGSDTITHFGIGLASAGTGTLLFSGALDASLNVTSGITPSFAVGGISVTAD